MDNKPKTKEVVRTIKEHTASAAKDKAVQIGVKTKDTVKGKVEEEFSPQQNRKQEQSPESYASDQVTETSERVVEDAGIVGRRAVKYSVKKVKEKHAERKNTDSLPQDEATDLTAPHTADNPEPENVETPKPANNSPKPLELERRTGTPSKANTAPDSSGTETPIRNESGQGSLEANPSDTDTTRAKKSNKKASAKGKEADSVSKSHETEPHSSKTTQQPKLTKQADNTGAITTSDDSILPDNKQAIKTKKPVAAADRKQELISDAEKKGIRRKTPDQTAIKERTLAKPKEAFKAETEVAERDIKPRTKPKSPPKQRGQRTVKNAGARTNEIRGIVGAPHKAKEAERGTVQTIKTADKTVKNAERTAKATKKAAEASAKAAKRSEEAARRTAKATIQATKAAVKAAIAGIKAAVAAGKELIAAAAAGSPAAIVIIIVICLIAAVGGTCFGIFLSNDETTGTQYTMTQAISQLNAEHYAEITDLKSRYSYDTMEMEGAGNISIDWKDVLAVYAVKTTTSADNAYEVATMDDTKMDLLRQVISDMNQISCIVVPRVVSETVTTTDSSGKTITTTQYVTKNILKVTVTRLTVDQIVAQYHFNDEQRKQLTELMSPDYDELWQAIIGTAGDVLITNSTYVPTDIFAWPLQSNGNLTSGFGYRHDPKTGEWKLHGGTDIAAPTGTPILASADGVVIAAQWHDSYGYYVKIQHNETFATLYGHCSALHVTAGQQVKQGQIIADVGETGYATGPHVHFEVYINGTRVDAMQYFK